MNIGVRKQQQQNVTFIHTSSFSHTNKYNIQSSVVVSATSQIGLSAIIKQFMCNHVFHLL